RTRVRVAPLRQLPAALQLLRDCDRILRRRSELSAGADALFDGPGDRWMGVALRRRAEAVVEVEHLVAVYVPDTCPIAAFEVDGPGVAKLVRGGDTADERSSGPLVHRTRFRRALVQRSFLPVGQLANALAVDLGRCLRGHQATLHANAGGAMPGSPRCDRPRSSYRTASFFDFGNGYSLPAKEGGDQIEWPTTHPQPR